MRIRAATEDDRPSIERLVRAAFGQELEVDLVHWIWRSDALLPELELVAEEDDEVVGHALHSVGHVEATAVAALAPLAVVPERQRQGVGAALLAESFARVDAAGFPLVALLGHPSYYPRFGFEPGVPLGIEPPEPMADTAPFMVKRLAGYNTSTRGRFRYAWDGDPTAPA